MCCQIRPAVRRDYADVCYTCVLQQLLADTANCHADRDDVVSAIPPEALLDRFGA